jgi:hypothetical protein
MAQHWPHGPTKFSFASFTLPLTWLTTNISTHVMKKLFGNSYNKYLILITHENSALFRGYAYLYGDVYAYSSDQRKKIDNPACTLTHLVSVLSWKGCHLVRPL